MRRGRSLALPFFVLLWLVPPLAFVGRVSQLLQSTGPAASAPRRRVARFSEMPAPPAMATVSFSHVHMYVDSLRELEDYMKLEAKLNAFVDSSHAVLETTSSRVGADVVGGRAAWLELASAHGDPCTGVVDPAAWTGQMQDVVEQMLVALGWRITGSGQTAETRSLVVTSKDESGVKFVITAHGKQTMQELGDALPSKRQKTAGDAPDHFDVRHLERFAQHQASRQGIAVLGFSVAKGGLDNIYQKYKTLHPKLLASDEPRQYPGAKILEVYAYYKGEKGTSEADHGTLLRFVESDAGEDFWVLPGLNRTAATFDTMATPAYCDHWVSNVVSRTGFLDTLEDTLGFTPKVDFNAGVVAAGEAQIESTVTGNDPNKRFEDELAVLMDQSQVFLPINNALSEVGHVHLYLKEIGQGVQHIASRVRDLPALVQRANDYRKMTGAGVSFLSIPRSYYGSLTAKKLSQDSNIDFAEAQKYMEALKKVGILDNSDIMDLDATREKVAAALPAGVGAGTLDWVMRGRYSNMYMLLGDHLSEASYLKIVSNNILVDVQGDDLLMQIFTSTVLQRAAGQEAPFLEFIQRVCSEKQDPATGKPKAMKPGCGGFGIRNFLTLFLSIEVSKATKARGDAEAAGNAKVAEYYGSMVEAFTAQLDESNPVLTAISDAMTLEGEALERGDKAEATKHEAAKNKGQEDLQTVSTKYKNLMKSLRENAPEGA